MHVIRPLPVNLISFEITVVTSHYENREIIEKYVPQTVQISQLERIFAKIPSQLGFDGEYRLWGTAREVLQTTKGKRCVVGLLLLLKEARRLIEKYRTFRAFLSFYLEYLIKRFNFGIDWYVNRTHYHNSLKSYNKNSNHETRSQ